MASEKISVNQTGVVGHHGNKRKKRKKGFKQVF
jgi:hypothetical protein